MGKKENNSNESNTSSKENDLKGKSKKAKVKIESIRLKTESLVKKLGDIKKDLKKIIPEGMQANSNNRLSMVKGVPSRLEFEGNCLKFYIDFTVTCQESEYPFIINGSIIYGTSRTMCFKECPEPYKIEECQRNVRCDCLEDKPLIEFVVGDDGFIRASGKLEDEWIINEDELTELHLRTMVIIWKDALDWSNEKIIP